MAESCDASRYDGAVGEFRLAPVIETLTRMIALSSDTKILDDGVRTGKGALALGRSGAQIVGLDYTDAMLQIARQKSVEQQVDIVRFLRAIEPISPLPKKSLTLLSA